MMLGVTVHETAGFKLKQSELMASEGLRALIWLVKEAELRLTNHIISAPLAPYTI